MTLAEGIRKHGFRKWYERELLAGHAHLALTFLCMVGVLLAFEASGKFHTLADKLIDATAAVVCVATGLWALRRYAFLLTRAEAVAAQAECPHCQTYGRLLLVEGRPVPHEAGAATGVRCKRCGHEWFIVD
jgi:hypothetical protein